MRYFTTLLAIIGMLTLGVTALPGCEEGPAEETGERIDEAYDDAVDATDDAIDETGDALEEAGDEIRDATDGR